MEEKEQIVNQIENKVCRVCNLELPLKKFRKGCIRCRDCEYKSIKCAHNILKIYCLKCGYVKLCVHNKNKLNCQECNITKFCIHKKSKNACIECNGSSICEHKKNRRECKLCLGSSYCIHKNLKDICREQGCNPTKICIHNIQKTRCRKGCGGSSICPHNKEKYYCIVCNPSKACQLCKSIYVKKTTRFYPLCEACFSYTNPGSELVTAYKVKERYLSDSLKDYFKDMEITLTFDKKVDGGCSKRRPDVFIDRLTHTIVVECDENQHKNYECENKRTMELFQDLGNRPMVLIRFNPDSYTRKSGEKQSSCFKPLIEIDDIHRKKFYNIEKLEWTRRLGQLIPTIQKYIDIDTFPNKEITIETLFYDNFD